MPELAPSRHRAPDRDHLGAAAGQRAHDGRSAPDVGVGIDHHAGGDATLDHRRTERAGVVVDETLVHDRRTGGEVRPEPDPVGVGDPHPRREDVVGHPRELVHAVHLRWPAVGGAQPQPGRLETVDRARSTIGPYDVGQYAEDALHRQPVRAHQAVGEQVQPQVGIRRVDRVGGQIGEHRAHDLGPHAAGRVMAREPGEFRGRSRPVVGSAQRRLWIPGVEDQTVVGHGGQAEAPCGVLRRHAVTVPAWPISI